MVGARGSVSMVAGKPELPVRYANVDAQGSLGNDMLTCRRRHGEAVRSISESPVLW